MAWSRARVQASSSTWQISFCVANGQLLTEAQARFDGSGLRRKSLAKAGRTLMRLAARPPTAWHCG